MVVRIHPSPHLRLETKHSRLFMKYIITSEKFAGEIEVEYNADNRLIRMDIRATLTEEQHDYILRKLPVYKDALNKWKTDYNHIKEIAIDLSFENFWRVYNYKFGSKTRAEKLWNYLSLADQLAAFAYIRVYDGNLAQGTTAKKYPETYLSKKDWIK